MNLRLRAGWSALALGFGLAGGASPAASQDDLPPPAPDCYITGGGLITVAGSDDKATFGITAADRAQIGQQQ